MHPYEQLDDRFLITSPAPQECCAWCEVDFWPSDSGAAHNTKFCCTACERADMEARA
jgi:hypothetical protein